MIIFQMGLKFNKKLWMNQSERMSFCYLYISKHAEKIAF